MMHFKAKRTPGQVAMLGIVTTFLVWLMASWWPTQWFAKQLRNNKNLGEPLYVHPDLTLYYPTDWIEWGWRFGDYDPLKPFVTQMTTYGYVTVFISIVFGLVVAKLAGKYGHGMETLHGSAQWADKDGVDSTGFLPSPGRAVSGVIVGAVMYDRSGEVVSPTHPAFDRRYLPDMQWRRIGGMFPRYLQKRDKDNVPMVKLNRKFVRRVEYLRDDNPAHILAFAPTRSGKGVGLVLPTLVTWAHSVVVNDIKGENWALSSGFRKAAGQIVFKFEPACQDGSCACWNPLDEIRIFSTNDVQDAQMVMMMICDPDGDGLEDHWQKTAFEFMVGVALHMRYVEKDASLAGIAHFLSDPAWETPEQMYTRMLQAKHDPKGEMKWKDASGKVLNVHPVVANAAKSMLNKPEEERGSVLSTAKSFLTLFLDPVVGANTARSDFLVRDLMNSDKPVSCYYVVQPNDLERMVSLTRLFFALILRRNATNMQFADGGAEVKSYKHRLLMLIDELPALRKMTILEEGLGYVAGYGIKCFLILQDPIQLERWYGKEHTIFAGCHVRLAYAPNTIETAERLEKMVGKMTVLEDDTSVSAKAFGADMGSASQSVKKTGRELITAAELLALSPEDMLMIVAGRDPIYGKKPKYYLDPVMDGRTKMPALALSDVVRRRVVEDAVVVEATPEEKAKADWAARKEAMREAVFKAAGSGGDSSGGAGRAMSGSGGRQKVAGEELAMVQALVKEVALVDAVTRISAF